MKKSLHPVDLYVGQRVRVRREEIGLTQRELAEKTDLRHQQLSKFERGEQYIKVVFLWEIASALGVKASYFVEGLDEEMVRFTSQNLRDTLSDHPDALGLIEVYDNLTPEERERMFKNSHKKQSD